jgi:succinyl-CoA synthetase beta subunit
MDLHEYQAKECFARYGIPVARGQVAATAAEAEGAAERLGPPVVVKAQVLTGGRGKAGGVKLCRSASQARAAAQEILGMDIRGHTVRTLLVDPAADIRGELYLAVADDRAARRPLIMASAAGGMDIETVNRETPELILRTHVDPQIGLRDYQIAGLASGLAHASGSSLPADLWRPFAALTRALYDCFRATDATLCEINPLAIVAEGDGHALRALDGKMSLDDNALFRQGGLAELRDASAEPAGETEARAASINYVKLDGQIGCMVNGAGLAMATMDLVGHFGGDHGIGPANFLDVSGGASSQQVATGLRIILSDQDVRAVLINIFGGITRGDEVARGIMAALEEVPTTLPMTIRLAGTNHEEGMRLLEEAGLANVTVAQSLQAAAQAAVDAAHGGWCLS